MITPITYPTALNFWLRAKGPIDEFISYYDFAGNSGEYFLKDVHLYDLTAPLHVMVPNASSRHKGNDIVSHVIPKGLPKDSFVQLTNSLYIITPECCFLMAAASLSVPELVVLANDLCAIYRLDPLSVTGQSSRKPITDLNKLIKYVISAGKVRGLDKARTALKYAADNSNSPMESRLAAIFSLPLMYGGFGLPKPELNYNVNLSPGASAYMERDCCCCDMVWLRQRIAGEYDSNLAHLTPEQHYYDKKRTTALSLSGYKTVSITAKNLSSYSEIENLCVNMRRVLGLRAQKDRLDKYSAIRRDTVNKIFFEKKKQVKPCFDK